MRQKQMNEFCAELTQAQATHVAAKHGVPAWICMDVGFCNNSHLVDTFLSVSHQTSPDPQPTYLFP